MAEYLLDANILSQPIYEPLGHVAGRIRRLEHLVCTSIVVAAELRFAAAKAGGRDLRSKVEELLLSLDIRPLESPADRLYAELRVDLERQGTPIGANDMLIAAHALALNCILVTDNQREFGCIKHLRVENWLL